jgi:gluconate 5-dehydrogenase
MNVNQEPQGMANPLFDLTGQIALVTGSSRGLGFAMARGLAAAGATVILNGRDEAALGEAVRQLAAEGFDARGYAFDITDAQRVAASVAAIESEVGAIAILVNNAGIQRRMPFLDFAEDAWRAVLDVNINGQFIVTQQVARRMAGRKAGKIINICSLMSEVGRQTIIPYATSKGGMKQFTKGLAVELAPHNIQVNGIGPGYFKTELNRALWEDDEFNAWVELRTPARRWG